MRQKNLVFQRPADGAVRDTKELEYIAALHQADGVKKDGTISAKCIQSMLFSRHAVSVPVKRIDSDIMEDLAGDPRGSNLFEKVLDIPQLTSLMILPVLAKAASSSTSEKDESVEQEKERIFGRVLRIILNDIGHIQEGDNSKDEILLSKKVLRTIFETYGEDEICDIGLEEMIDQVAGADFNPESDRDSIVLNRDSFMKALTSDLGEYASEWESTRSTHFDDFLTLVDGGIDEVDKVCRNRKPIKIDDAKDEECPTPSLAKPGLGSMTLVNSYDSVDITIDSFKSQSFFILVFISLNLSFISYFSGQILVEERVQCSKGDFGCELGRKILSWLSLAFLIGIIGGGYILFASSGNGGFKGHYFWMNLLGMLAVYFACIHPFFFPLLTLAVRKEDDELMWAPYFSVTLGIVILIQKFVLLLRYLVHYLVGGVSFLSRKATIQQKELNVKEAATWKSNGLITHALQHHGDSSKSPKDGLDRNLTRFRTSQDMALLNFEEKLNDTEPIGGYWWTWTKYFEEDLCKKEGVWIGARLVLSQLGQMIVLFGFTFVLLTLLSFIHNEFEEKEPPSFSETLQSERGIRAMYVNQSGGFIYRESEIDDSFLSSNNLQFGYYFDQDLEMYKETTKERVVDRVVASFAAGREVAALLTFDASNDLINQMAAVIKNTTGIELERAVEYIEVFSAYEGGILSFLYKEIKKQVSEEELRTAIIFGWVCAVMAILNILCSFFPRYISQTLMYRNGVNGSPLTDPSFASLKKSAWVASNLFGTTFWGALIAGITVWSVCGVVLFLFVWSETSHYALSFLAVLIGIMVSWILKKSFLTLVRKRAYSGLYRIDLGVSNITTLILEAWNIGIAIGSVFARAVRMLLITCVYIGRIDTNLLAPHVTFFGLQLDKHYAAFDVDILLHESHRHPYLERLGLLYLIKLHEGPTFVKRQGSCWRLLYVLALMPWMQKYRSKQMRMTDVERKRHALIRSSGKMTLVDSKFLKLIDSEESWEENRVSVFDQK